MPKKRIAETPQPVQFDMHVDFASFQSYYEAVMYAITTGGSVWTWCDEGGKNGDYFEAGHHIVNAIGYVVMPGHLEPFKTKTCPRAKSGR